MATTEIQPHLTETTIDGLRTKRWELNAADCPALAAHRIARIGLHDVAAPYRRVRVHPTGSFLMACFAGQGRVLLDGRWQIIRAGTACMAPPRVLNAFAAVSTHRWAFAWVRYDEPSPVVPIVGADSPVRVRTDAEVLRRIVEGLRAEWEAARDPRALHHWIELAHGCVRRLAQPWHGRTNAKLQQLWEGVGAALADNWTLEQLAVRSHMSKEKLRRACLRELGRSPMQHLTYMRMQRAQELLEASNDKLEVVGAQVGYDSAVVFSRAFKRWIGRSPSEYRQGS